MPVKKHFNPFYALLILAGLVFAVTAFAHGFMAFEAVNALRADADRHAAHPLNQWLRAHGDAALLVELTALAVLTVAAIGTDRFWDRSDREQDDFDRLQSSGEQVATNRHSIISED